MQEISLTWLVIAPFGYGAVLLIHLISKGCPTIRTHRHNLPQEDHVISTGIFGNYTCINERQRSIQNGGSCRGNMVICMTEIFVSLLGAGRETTRKRFLFAGQNIDGECPARTKKWQYITT